MAVKVSFCTDFSSPAELVLIPLTESGFLYPLPNFTLTPSTLLEITSKLSFGNILDFGPDASNRHIYGIYMGYACDWNDFDALIAAVQYGIYNIHESHPEPITTVLLSPLSENPEWDALNTALFTAFFNYFRFENLQIPVQSQTCKSFLKSIFSNLAQSGCPISLPLSRDEFEKTMKSSKLTCYLCEEYAENAMMTVCCQVPACEVCAQFIELCPNCGNRPNWTENKHMRKTLSDMQYICKCEQTMLVRDIGKHRWNCMFSQYRCRKCYAVSEIYTKSDLVQHLEDRHKDDIMREMMELSGR